MNHDAPHTILLVTHPRVRLALRRLSRVLGVGVYHFEGDLRPAFKALSQVKALQRGAIELFFEPGDTKAFLRRQICQTSAAIEDLYTDGKTPDAETANTLTARLDLLHVLAGRNGVALPADESADIMDIKPSAGETPEEETVPVMPNTSPIHLTEEDAVHAAQQLFGMSVDQREEACKALQAKLTDENYQDVLHALKNLGQEARLKAAASPPPPADEKEEEEPAAASPASPDEETTAVETCPGSDPTTRLNGIGKRTAERLAEREYRTVADIARATPENLAEVLGISRDQAIAHIAEARARSGVSE